MALKLDRTAFKAAPPRLLLTMFSDASWCPETGAAGWGAWFKHGNMDQGGLASQAVGKLLASSHEAEAVGVWQALRIIKQRGYLDSVGAVQVQCDSVRTLGAIYTHVPNTQHNRHQSKHNADVLEIRQGLEDLTEAETHMVNFMISVADRYDLTYQVRHVKGHQHGKGRNWVNRKCDYMAKRQMRVRRKDV